MTDNAAANLEASHSEPRLRPGELSMRSQRDGHVHTISLAGELDLANAHDVEAELIRVETTDASTILLDLAGLTFMDSTAIRLLITADARSRSNGHRLTLRRAPDGVHRVLQICGVADRLPFTDKPDPERAICTADAVASANTGSLAESSASALGN